MRPERTANQAGHGARQYGNPEGRDIDLQSSPSACVKRVDPRTKTRYRASRKPERNQKGQAGRIKKETASRTQARAQARKVVTDRAFETTRAGTDGATHHGTNRKTRKPKKGRKRRGRKKSPTGGRNQVTRQTRRAVDRIRGTSQDCTRIFPVKGADNALCNPETDVHGDLAVGPRAMRDSEAIQATTLRRLGQPTPASLQDQRAKGGPSLSHKRSRVLEGALPGLYFVEDIGNRGRSRREVRGAKQSSGGRGRSRRGVGVEVTPPGSGGLGGRRRLGFSSSGETVVNSATAEQTTSRIALWRKTDPHHSNKGVIPPAVENFPAHAASRVAIP